MKFIAQIFQKGLSRVYQISIGETPVLGKPVWGRRDSIPIIKLAMIKISSKNVLKLKLLLIVM